MSGRGEGVVAELREPRMISGYLWRGTSSPSGAFNDVVLGFDNVVSWFGGVVSWVDNAGS